MTIEPEKKKLYVFMGFLAILALTINIFVLTHEYSQPPAPRVFTSRILERQIEPTQDFGRKSPSDDSEEKTQKVSDDAVAEHARYLKRYLRVMSVRKTGVERVALAVSADDTIATSDLTTALNQHFQTNSCEIIPSFFTPEFVSDGLINDLFNGSDAVIDSLELTNLLDALLLAKQTVQYSRNSTALQNVLTATMRLDLRVIPIGKHEHTQTWTLAATGAGFKESDARAMAEERIIKQIASDIKMSIYHPSTETAK